jgi:hypothetical protein
LGTLEQWAEVLIYGALFGGLMFVFVVFPESPNPNSTRAVVLKSAALVFGSLGFGMIEVFGLHALLHGGLVWTFVASLVTMALSGVLLRLLRTRTRQLGPN